MRKFSVNDRVKWCGIEGIVMDAGYDAITVYFDSTRDVKLFTEDGKSKPYYLESSLELVEDEK